MTAALDKSLSLVTVPFATAPFINSDKNISVEPVMLAINV